VAKTLLTGGTGFLGAALACALAERGDDLRLTLREGASTELLDEVDFEPAKADILDRRALRRALTGVDRVFHAAGSVSFRPGDEDEMFRVNVEGTRTVLEECLRAGVERVVYTSTASAVGPAEPGKTADETQIFTAGHLGLPYVNSKHEAEVEALRLAAQGLPLVVVNPCFVFGRGDLQRSSTSVVRRFLLGRISMYTDGGINVIDVGDVAAGHLLADEKGKVGERYILGNRNYTWDRLFADLSRLSGVEPPPLKLPAPLALRLVEAMEAARMRPPVTAIEVRSASQWWTYRSTKAKRELGWSPSPHEDTLEATIEWYLEREGDRLARARRTQPVTWKVAARIAGAIEGTAAPLAAIRRLRPRMR
jgi:dihydroflavonol-4-reductase